MEFGFFIFGLMVLIFVSLIFRKFYLWYWKVDEIISLLEAINNKPENSKPVNEQSNAEIVSLLEVISNKLDSIKTANRQSNYQEPDDAYLYTEEPNYFSNNTNSTWVCPDCGMENGSKKIYCSKCGRTREH